MVACACGCACFCGPLSLQAPPFVHGRPALPSPPLAIISFPRPRRIGVFPVMWRSIQLEPTRSLGHASTLGAFSAGAGTGPVGSRTPDQPSHEDITAALDELEQGFGSGNNTARQALLSAVVVAAVHASHPSGSLQINTFWLCRRGCLHPLPDSEDWGPHTACTLRPIACLPACYPACYPACRDEVEAHAMGLKGILARISALWKHRSRHVRLMGSCQPANTTQLHAVPEWFGQRHGAVFRSAALPTAATVNTVLTLGAPFSALPCPQASVTSPARCLCPTRTIVGRSYPPSIPCSACLAGMLSGGEMCGGRCTTSVCASPRRCSRSCLAPTLTPSSPSTPPVRVWEGYMLPPSTTAPSCA